jgi:polar amino acid transport system substrate-binding protein
VAIGLAVAGALPARADTIRLVADDWFPYNGTPGAVREGYLIDIARAIARDDHDQVSYQLDAWQDAIRRVRSGESDCVMGATSVDSSGLRFGPETFGRTVNVFYTLMDSRIRIDAMGDLTRWRLAVIAGYDYGDTLGRYLAVALPGKIATIANRDDPLEVALRDLLAHRVDVLVDDPNVVTAAAERLGIAGRIRPAGQLPEELDLYFACTPTGDRGSVILDKLNAGIRRLRSSGELAIILARYGMKDWRELPPQAVEETPASLRRAAGSASR